MPTLGRSRALLPHPACADAQRTLNRALGMHGPAQGTSREVPSACLAPLVPPHAACTVWSWRFRCLCHCGDAKEGKGGQLLGRGPTSEQGEGKTPAVFVLGGGIRTKVGSYSYYETL
jgi:hypothetical protein